MNDILSENNILYICNCNICYINIYSIKYQVTCRICNQSNICMMCFDLMKIKNDLNDICCPNCNNIYYGYLRNSIVKYALEYSLGIKYNTRLFNSFINNKYL